VINPRGAGLGFHCHGKPWAMGKLAMVQVIGGATY